MRNVFNSLIFLFISVPFAYGESSSIYSGIGYSNTNYQDEVSQSIIFNPGQQLDESSNMLNLYAGFQVNNYLSAEIGYSEFGTAYKEYVFNPDWAFAVTPDNKKNVDFNNITINSMLSYPLHERIYLYGLLGYSFINIEQVWSGGFNPGGPNTTNVNSFTEDGIFYGVGARYLFNDKYSVRFQWTRVDASNVTLEAFQFLLQMRIHTF